MQINLTMQPFARVQQLCNTRSKAWICFRLPPDQVLMDSAVSSIRTGKEK
jgi:hypothetical protein